MIRSMGKKSRYNRMASASHRHLENFRLRISRPDAILQLSVLGLLAGLLAGVTIIALRLLVEYAQLNLLPMTVAEHYESLSSAWRVGLALGGGLLVGVMYRFIPEGAQYVGIGHVLERMAYYQGRLTWRNAVVQFIGGAISMISGHSVGREGPSAHLGAASSNIPAQALGLPHNSLRVLAACGAAAGIAASFNTPLAGAAFAMEVLLMEYSVAGFAPVILATVSATALTQWVFGTDLAYNVPSLTPGHLAELPYILLCGLGIGLLAEVFNGAFEWFSRQAKRWPLWLRPMLGGCIVALCGLLVPQVMGMGDDTVNEIILGEVAIGMLLLVLVVKIIASAGGIGLGLPGGIIGPILFVGAAGGGLLGAVGVSLGITQPESLGMYALIGMGAMMAGSLQAPLAGLIAILEMTGEPNFILPGMLAVVAATISAGRGANRESIFHRLLRARGLDFRNDPVTQSLRRMGVASVMNRRVEVLNQHVAREAVDRAIAKEPVWILVREPNQVEELLAAVDLVRARAEQPDVEEFDLLAIPGKRLETTAIDMRASLQEAADKIQQTAADAVYVTSQSVPGIKQVYGVLTQEDISRSYRTG